MDTRNNGLRAEKRKLCEQACHWNTTEIWHLHTHLGTEIALLQWAMAKAAAMIRQIAKAATVNVLNANCN